METGIAAKAGLVEIPGQEKLPDFSAHLLRQFSCYHAGVPLMALPVNDRNFHRGDLLSFVFFLRLLHTGSYRLSDMAAPAQARPRPGKVTAVCRFPAMLL